MPDSFIDLYLQDSSAHYQQNKARAEKLLEAYRQGDTVAIRHFTEHHPRGKDPGFTPTLIDARLMVMGDNVRPRRLRLAPLKKQAKRLLKAWASADAETLQQVAVYYPGGAAPAPSLAKLADAQLVVARQQGLESWPKLKTHIEAMDHAEAALSETDQAIDQDVSTLHIRGGSDIENTLPKAGLKAEFFNVLEVYVTGPLRGGADTDLDDFLKSRAEFLAATYPEVPDERDMSVEKVLEGLRNDQEKLREAGEQYARLCLWFEHDTHDQLVLAMVLHRYLKNRGRASLEMITPDHFPGVRQFLGLGALQQHPEMLRLLWQHRKPVNQAQIDLGAQVWEAVCAAEPTTLWNIAQMQSAPLPHMPRALRWHLENLPDVKNGLSRIEQRSLRILARDGVMGMAKLFSLHNYEADPLPTLGDLTFYGIIRELILADLPAIRYQSYNPDAPPLLRGELAITETGHALLANKANWLELTEVDRWVGGLHIVSGRSHWCWDSAKGPVLVNAVSG